jgi:hypothetical protein
MPDDHHDQQEPTQLTQPKGINPETGEPYEPVEIPVPKRTEWERVLARAAHTKIELDDGRADKT